MSEQVHAKGWWQSLLFYYPKGYLYWLLFCNCCSLFSCRSVACPNDVLSPADDYNKPDKCQSEFTHKHRGSLCVQCIPKNTSVGCCFVIASPCFHVAVLLVLTMFIHLPTPAKSQTNCQSSFLTRFLQCVSNSTLNPQHFLWLTRDRQMGSQPPDIPAFTQQACL